MNLDENLDVLKAFDDYDILIRIMNLSKKIDVDHVVSVMGRRYNVERGRS